MRWIFEQYTQQSEHNGPIIVRRAMGNWLVLIGGVQITGPDLDAVWKDALDRSAYTIAPKKVLMVGLGGGGSLHDIYKRFDGVTIVAVEHDPAMIEISKELRLWAPYPAPTIHQGDAQKVVQNLDELFDLILVDIFTGERLSPLVSDPSFLENLKRILAPSGAVIINAYKTTEALEVPKSIFTHAKIWKYYANSLGTYWE